MSDEAPIPPVPLQTDWTVDLLAGRAPRLTAAEIIAIAENIEALEAVHGPGASLFPIMVEVGFIKEAEDPTEARRRESLFGGYESPQGRIAFSARKAAERGGAEALGVNAAMWFGAAAKALMLRDRLTPEQFAMVLWPVVAAIGEPTVLDRHTPPPPPAEEVAAASVPTASGGCMLPLAGFLIIATSITAWRRPG